MVITLTDAALNKLKDIEVQENRLPRIDADSWRMWGVGQVFTNF